MNKKTLSVLFFLTLLVFSLVFTPGCIANSSLASTQELAEQVKALENKVNTQVETLAGLDCYVSVASVTEALIIINVNGAGVYPVIITILGSSLNDGKVSITGANCAITAEYQPSSSVLYVAIVPTTSWKQVDTIKLNVSTLNTSGDIHYVLADIGAK